MRCVPWFAFFWLFFLSDRPLVSISLTSPAEGQEFTASRIITVTGAASAPAGYRPWVFLTVNGKWAGSPSVVGGEFRATVALADGANTIEAFARSGPFFAKTAVHVTYRAESQTPLALWITAPLDGDTLTGDRITAVRGTFSGAPDPSVAVSVNGGPEIAATVGAGGFSADVPLADGENTIVARAISGAESASSTVHVTYAPTPPPEIVPPAIAITSFAEGQVVLGSRNVTVRGTFAGAPAPSVLVTVNAGVPVTATLADGTFAAEVQLADRANVIVATVIAGDAMATASVRVKYPFLTLDPFQVAERVLGQPGPSSPAQCVAITASDVCFPSGSAGWDGTTLFLSDWARSRILSFLGIPTVDGAAANFVLGQANFSGSAPSGIAAGLAGPETSRVADGKLFVTDNANNRVLIYDPVPTGSAPSASIAVGAASPDMRGSSACAADALFGPESLVVAGTKLIVADTAHNRVLVWNEIPTVSGMPADLVLGQPDLTTCDDNAGGLSPRSLSWPTDVWSDGTRLYVADSMNNRILGWSSFPQTSYAPADFVLGQDSFEIAQGSNARGGLAFPYFLASNGNQLFVADYGNNRLLVWNALPTAGGALPDVVLGQGDWDRSAADDDDQDGVPEALPTGRTLSSPAGVTAIEDALIVTDGGNSRYLVFRAR